MSKVTETSRLRIEDFPKQRDWIRPLLEAYNNFLAQVVRILNNGINFNDNFVGLSHDFDFTFQSQANSFPLSIKWPYDSFPPKHVYSTFASEEGTQMPVVISWKFTDTRFVQLTSVYKFNSTPAVANLTAGSDYKVRVKIEP